MLIAAGAAPRADGAVLPGGVAALPVLRAGAAGAGGGRGPAARPRGLRRDAVLPAGGVGRPVYHFWRGLKAALGQPCGDPNAITKKKSQPNPQNNPKKQRRGRKLGSRRSPRSEGKNKKEFFPEQSRSLGNSPACSAGQGGSIPAGRPPTDRPRSRLLRPPQVPGEGKDAARPDPLPHRGRAASALSGRRQGSPRGRR